MAPQNRTKIATTIFGLNILQYNTEIFLNEITFTLEDRKYKYVKLDSEVGMTAFKSKLSK